MAKKSIRIPGWDGREEGTKPFLFFPLLLRVEGGKHETRVEENAERERGGQSTQKKFDSFFVLGEKDGS